MMSLQHFMALRLDIVGFDKLEKNIFRGDNKQKNLLH